MIIRRFLLLLCLLTAFGASVFAQQDSIPLTTIIEKTSKFSSSYPIEKVYLHTDKPYYAVGDTIWFKAYVTIEKHQPSALSRIVYVDLINNRDSVVESQRITVTNGFASGNIVLNGDTYKQGAYRLRSYTNWMRNFDPDYFYDHTFNVGNAIDNQVRTNITYKSSSKKTGVKVDATILYKGPDNSPYANKKVNWQLMKNGDPVSKGHGTTDDKGVLQVDLPESQADVITGGILVTAIDVGDRKTISSSFSMRTAVKGYDVQFFPEGGQLTNGIRTKVAFKAIASSGMGVDVKGTIVDDKGAEVAQFSSAHLGMGVFALTPDIEKSYKANVTFPDGSQATYNLPRVQSMGINISVYNTDPANLTVKISANDLFFQRKQNKSFYLVAQSGGVIYYAAQTVLQSTTYSANIPKSKFPTGIVQVTLFSSGGYALCERIVFIQHNDQMNLALKTDKPSYTTRGNVKITVSAKNNTTPTEGSFSVAVVDDGTVPSNEDAESTILSNMLLTSDLKGYIEKPNYYFNKPDDEKLGNLDILMLTQGYRRFDYEDILADKNPPIYLMPEQGIDVTGTLRTNTGLPVAKGSLRLLIPDKNFSAETITDMSGNFKFSNVNVPDTSKITLSARNNPNGRNLVISVNGEAYQKLSKNNNIPDEILNIDSTFRPYLQNSYKQYQSSRTIKEVVVKATKIVKKASHTDYGTFAGLPMQADHEISAQQLDGCPLLINCLSTMAMGLTYVDNNFYITRDYNSGSRTPVQIYVGSLPVDANFLSSMASNEVESVEIFLNDGVSGINRSTQTKGVMVINKKVVKKQKITLAQLQELIPKQNVVTFAVQGYTKAKEFYSPKYDVTKAGTLGGDLRNTIYWKPNVITDKTTGTATINFFNSDQRGSYRAIIEGIDAEGNIGRSVIHYNVK
ncbi:carboxypeptidase regulatory-like domain-containing protein [Mucilaginibacter sp. SMC90]|uniref:carboxypeptidase regulatory-like domain-containing protein n=1 Tax=Mucilaginibacter sp. SMC90 TaxID=2929803 RepID=UPI001FB22226|nr:carboxypeptidase regulatory-like domain-containing protein [Mucilaginibacter sp. SMC90]UOE51633.1 carboxypeptidase regulatory-like domain-containing protein [Mucilaginibacter sp. SMC90]